MSRSLPIALNFFKRSSLFILSLIDNETWDRIGPASSLLINLKIYLPFYLFFLFALLLLNIIIFVIPYRINKSLIKDPLSNIENIENLSN